MPHAARSAHHSPRTSDDAVAALAKQTDTSPEVVKRLYEEEIAALHDKASVKHFVDVIASRRVKQRLKAAKAAKAAKAVKAKGRH